MIGFYDIETDGLDVRKCRFLCGATLTLPGRQVRVYGTESIGEMIRSLHGMTVRIGFNSRRFDDPILARFGLRPTSPTPIIGAAHADWDVYWAVRNAGAAGAGWSQGDIASAMLEAHKDNSSEIPRMFRCGRIASVIDHCVRDVQSLYRICLSAYRNRGRIKTTGGRSVTVAIPAAVGRFLACQSSTTDLTRQTGQPIIPQERNGSHE